jgi:nucleolin
MAKKIFKEEKKKEELKKKIEDTDSEVDSSSDDSSSDEETPKKTTKTRVKKEPVKEEDSDSEEEETPSKKAIRVEESSSSEEEDSDDEEEDEEEEEKPETNKRKRDEEKETPAPKKQKIGSKKVKVSNIVFENYVDAVSQLNDVFSKFGTIIEVSFNWKQNNATATITFSDAEEAEEALSAKGTKLGDKEIDVTAEVASKPASGEGFKVWVGNLSDSTTSESLKSGFEECGEILSAERVEGRRFGFITFAEESGAQKAVEYSGTDFEGTTIKVELKSGGRQQGGRFGGKQFGGRQQGGRFGGRQQGGQFGGRKGGKKGDGKTVFVGNLSYRTNEDSLREGFAECGEVVRVAIPQTDDGRSKGFGFVEFADESGVQSALQYDGTDFEGRNIRVRL